jgi:hypothetical protein
MDRRGRLPVSLPGPCPALPCPLAGGQRAPPLGSLLPSPIPTPLTHLVPPHLAPCGSESASPPGVRFLASVPTREAECGEHLAVHSTLPPPWAPLPCPLYFLDRLPRDQGRKQRCSLQRWPTTGAQKIKHQADSVREGRHKQTDGPERGRMNS